MKVFQAIEERRAVKRYNAESKMLPGDFDKIMSAAVLSPTSYNIQHWRFVRVTDKAQREKLKDAAWGQEQVASASELVILCADINAWSDRPQRYVANTPQETQDMLLPMIDAFYNGKEQIQRDETMRSCGIAAQTIMLAAKGLGYDTCPMVGFDREEVARLIRLPQGYVIAMMIAIGKAEQPAHSRGGQLPLSEVLSENHF
ncbi:nitroreductase family protein [Colwellia sp. Arc7-635]|jgi:nitroreductase|uniref:nitroreductase family protein n=1 Tax=Colwellia sp. Arc7-635 TaxID=2497879 RepID=UPI000F84F708|nr:nitroreductase family protein [Colwellia sp. Arc7-635]AZQ85040.1 nitroreductase family protein [Colwellia sp. Arc7-635]